MARWSRCMMFAHDARDPGFDSRTSPFFSIGFHLRVRCASKVKLLSNRYLIWFEKKSEIETRSVTISYVYMILKRKYM